MGCKVCLQANVPRKKIIGSAENQDLKGNKTDNNNFTIETPNDANFHSKIYSDNNKNTNNINNNNIIDNLNSPNTVIVNPTFQKKDETQQEKTQENINNNNKNICPNNETNNIEKKKKKIENINNNSNKEVINEEKNKVNESDNKNPNNDIHNINEGNNNIGSNIFGSQKMVLIGNNENISFEKKFYLINKKESQYNYNSIVPSQSDINESSKINTKVTNKFLLMNNNPIASIVEEQ